MLNRVKLSYFQQHRALEVNLGSGLTAIRGANESGKSTLLRGICYALFGAKAMPDTLDNLVTWGEDVRKLKAEVEFTAEGVKYHVKRSKSGAELNYDGGRVTGQNEVTAFVCRLLRVDAAAAPRLMLSNQNEIRGALEAGPKETTALIERLSDFDQIDAIVELIQENLSLGSTATVEAAIEAGRRQLDEARAAAVEPDLKALGVQIEASQQALEAAQGDLANAQARADAAQIALSDGRVAAKERDALLDTIAKARERIDELDVELEEIDTLKAPDNVEAEIQRRRDAISAEERRAEQQQRKDRVTEIDAELARQRAVAAPAGDVEVLRGQLSAHERDAGLAKKFAQLAGFTGPRPAQYGPAEVFKGTLEDLEAQIAVQRSSKVEAERLAARARSEADLLRAQLTAGSCGFCGQDFSNVPEVQAKNAEIERGIARLDADARARLESASEAGLEQDRLQGIKEASQPALRVLAVVGADYAALADDLLPPVLKWVGPTYSSEQADPAALRRQIEELETAQRAYDRAQTKIESLVGERDRLAKDLPETLPAPVDARALRREIRDLEAAQEAYTRAQAKRETLAAERDRLIAKIGEIEVALEDHPPVDLEALQAAADAARAALAPAQQAVMDAQRELNAAKQARSDAVAGYERARAAVTAAAESLEARQQELRDLIFNNKLLKDVRSARPIIADKLWNMVLAAVSRYFSEMRGVESVVTKGQDGFMVDGHVVSPATLSGSALDILGLAIRVALVKTFLPACPFFVLDEPAQGCDDNRTANLLSFLSACGFAQVLLVTHEDTSESVAQNMITIGG